MAHPGERRFAKRFQTKRFWENACIADEKERLLDPPLIQPEMGKAALTHIDQ